VSDSGSTYASQVRAYSWDEDVSNGSMPFLVPVVLYPIGCEGIPIGARRL
jgi:hypothetical protein